MKKSVAVILIILVLFCIAFIFPITQKTTINISATFDNTLLQIIHLENWKNWYPEIKEAYKNNPADYSLKEDTSKKIYTINIPGKKYIIHAISPMSYEVSEVSNNDEDIFAFTVFPGGAPGKMQINLIRKTSLIFILFNKNNAGKKVINELKSYLEDPKQFYGFEIKKDKIRDSIIASKSFRIKKEDMFLKIHNAYLDLMQYIKTNNLVKTDHVSISYIPLQDDSIEITVGIPVNKVAAENKEINCLLLPAKGNILVGKYEGKFSNRQKIYFAMSKYMTDHTLSTPAESFERYLNDSIPVSDSSVIKIELNYPIY